MQFVTARGSAGMAVVLSASMLVLGGQWPRVAEAATHGPDLGVTILGADADARGVLTPDQTATVTVGVHNLRGDAEAHNTTLTVVVPGALAVKRARPMPDRTEPDNEGTRLIWTLGTVPAGAFPRLFALDLQASPDLKGNSELRIRASVATSDVDPNDRNNRVTYMLVVGTAAAQLNVTSNLDSVPFTVDRAVQLSIDVTNARTIAAAASDLTMTFPPKPSVQSRGPASPPP